MTEFTPKIGFEAEFIRLAETGMEGSVEFVRQLLQTSFPKPIVCETLTLFDEPDFTTDNWYVCADSSICEDLGTGIEIVTPPKIFNDGMGLVHGLLSFIRQSGITDETCGFHFTLSAPGIDTIDPVELLFLMEEETLVNLWNRGGNEYAYPHLKTLAAAVRTNLHYHSGFDTFLRDINKELVYQKRCTVNLEKWVKDGMLEFRVVGGPHYEHRPSVVFSTILQCFQAVEACISGSRRAQYLELARAFYDKHIQEKHPSARYREPRSN